MKSSVDEIRQRFDADVERFSNLETGQSATIDAPLAMALVAHWNDLVDFEIVAVHSSKDEAALYETGVNSREERSPRSTPDEACQ